MSDDHVHTSRWSLRARLGVPALGLVLGGILMQALMSYQTTLSEVDETSDYQMRQLANSLGRSAILPLASTAPKETDDDGDGLYLLIEERADGIIRRLTSDTVLPTHIPTGFSIASLPSGQYRIYSSASQHHQVIVAQSILARQAFAREMALAAIWPPLVLGVILLASIAAAIRSVTKPIARLRDQMLARSKSNLQPVDGIGLPSELMPLIEETNALIARIQVLFTQHKRFVADAAHGLRTPLAALSLQTDLIERAFNTEERANALIMQREGIARATHIVDQLLVLARLDEATTETPNEQFALDQVTREVVQHLTAIAQRRGSQIELIVADHCAAVGDRVAVGTLLENLVENAIKHTAPGSKIRVSVRPDHESVVLKVEDNGAGIPECDVGRVLERFQRGRDVATMGSGLGLAIVKAIADRAGYSLVLSRSALGGLQVSVRCPKNLSL